MQGLKKKITNLDDLAVQRERLTKEWNARHPEFAADDVTLQSWRKGIEWDRKGIHLMATLFALATHLFSEPYVSIGLLAVTIFVLAVDVSRLAMKSWAILLYRHMPYVFRQDERHQISGASVLMTGIFMTSVFFTAKPATAGILCLVWGDSAAALVGQFYKHWRLMRKLKKADPNQPPAVKARSRKTLAGSLGCLFVSMVMILIVCGWQPEAILFGGITATVMERWTPGSWDNLTIPLGTAFVVHSILSGWIF